MIKRNKTKRAKSVAMASLVAATSTLTNYTIIEAYNQYEEMLEQKEQEELKRIFAGMKRVEKELAEKIEFEKKVQERRELNKKLREEQRKKEEEERRQIEKLRVKTGLNVTGFKKVTFVTTAYSSLPEENGGWTVTCNGEPLEGNIVANNIIPQNTKILLGDRVVRVADRGSKKHFNVEHRLDVLVERKYGESDNQYRKRISNYGKQKIEGYILEIE